MSAESDALVRAYESASASVRDRVAAYALAVWGASAAYRDEDVRRIVARVVPAVQAGQLQLAALTDAYIGRLASLEGVAWSARVDRDVVGYRGVPVAEVYRRPAVAVYTSLAEGKVFTDAVKAGTARLASIVTTDLQQARNRQANRSLAGSGFQFYRRVLSGKEDCDLCRLASQHRYKKADLMPIHPGCDCAVQPVRGFDSESMAGAETVTVNIHGELGPTLGWASDTFTSEADIAALA